MKTFYFLFVVIFLVSCNRFEEKFYSKITQGERNSIKLKSPVDFDLTSITEFDWDSVIIIHGNESVPVLAEQIEVDLKRETTDLPTYTDRFYFLQKDKNIIVREIESMIHHNPDVNIELCLIDSANYRPWLARDECKFKLMSNSKKVGQGGIFLFPPCKTWVTEKSLRIFD